MIKTPLIFLLFMCCYSVQLTASCEGKTETTANFRVTSCVLINGKALIRDQASYLNALTEVERQSLASAYDGFVVGGENRKPLKYFYQPSHVSSCKALMGKTLRGDVHFNCCDGDPGVPCLLPSPRPVGTLRNVSIHSSSSRSSSSSSSTR